LKQITETDITQYGEICEKIESAGGAVFEVRDSQMAIKVFDFITENPKIHKATITITRLPNSKPIAQNP
jgi:hypothetical protein